MTDENTRELLRELPPEHPRVLAALARAGTPRTCLFCDHVLTGLPKCGARPEYQLGGWVYAPDPTKRSVNIPVGRYIGNNQVGLSAFSEIHDEIMVQPRGVIELPEAWKKPPCACDHTNVPSELSMEDYQERHGIDARVCALLDRGSIVYSTAHRNANGTPMRFRVTGQLKTFKRSARFRMPIKYSMYGKSDQLDQYTCVGFRTEELWAYSYGERLLRNMSTLKAQRNMYNFQATQGRPR